MDNSLNPAAPDLPAAAETPPGISWRRMAAVFLLAFALRAVFLLQWAHLPYAGNLCADAWVHDRWALEILKGGLLRHTAFYQSPFYPYFLAAFYKLFGHHYAPVFWAQALADSFSCLLIMRAGELCYGRAAGLIAGLAAALYRPFIFSTGLLTKETFAVLAAALMVVLLLRAARLGRARDHLFWGLAAGWGALSRPNLEAVIPFALLWLWLARGGAVKVRCFFFRAVLPALLGAALFILPGTLHNYLASGDLVLFNYAGGFVFYLGSNPEATGTTSYPAGITSDPQKEEKEVAAIAEKAAGRSLKPSEISSYWLHKGLAFVVSNPLAALRLTAAKFFLFWNRYEIPDNYDLQFVSDNFSTMLRWPLAGFALAGCLGALGLFLAGPRGPSGVLTLLFWPYLASLLVFIMTDRYRLPAAALLLPAAGGAAMRVYGAARAGAWRPLKKPFLLALPFMLICLCPAPFNLAFNEAAGWGQLAGLYAERGQNEAALEAFGRAYDINPAAISDSAVVSAAAALQELGRNDEALGLYERWCAVYPNSALLLKNRGALLYKLGRYRESAALLQR